MTKLAFLALLPLSVLAAEPWPRGWFLGGQREGYRLEEVEGTCGAPTALELAARPHPLGSATAMRLLEAEPFRGQRLRFSATLTTAEVHGRAGLWMRVDGAEPHRPLAMDTMQDRPLTLTRGCTEVAVVLDVPLEAVTIAAGAVLEGQGRLELSGVRFEVVPPSVPVTDLLPRHLVPGAPGLQPEELPNELAESKGRVDGVWFNDFAIDGPGLTLHLRNPSRWSDRTQDSLVTVQGDALHVKLGAYQGDFTFRRQGGAWVLAGTWGAAVKYPVAVSLGPERLDMAWGPRERHLTREHADQVEPDCARFTQYSGAVMAPSDWLYVCGAPLEASAPPAQTAAALLMIGFQRNRDGQPGSTLHHW